MAFNDGMMQYFAKIGLDASEFLNGMEKSQKGVLSFYRDVSVTMAATMMIFDKFMQYGQKFVELSNQAMEYVSTIDKLSVTTGMSTAELQRWANVARYADSDIETLSASINKMQINLSTQGEAGDKVRQMLDDMRVSYKNADGSLKSSAELFPEIIQGLKGLENSSDRVVAANAIFGRSYQSLAGYMNLSKQEMEEYFTTASVLTEEQTQELRDYEQAIKDLNASTQELSNTAGAELAPAFTEWAELLNGIADNEGVQAFFSGLGSILQYAARGFHIIGQEAKAAYQLMRGDIGGSEKTMEDLAKWTLDKQREDILKEQGYTKDSLWDEATGRYVKTPKPDKGTRLSNPDTVSNPDTKAEEDRLKSLKTATDDYTKAVNDLAAAYEGLNDINKDYSREMSILNTRDVARARDLTIRHTWAVEDEAANVNTAKAGVAAASVAVGRASMAAAGITITGPITVNGDKSFEAKMAELNRTHGIGVH
jgi:hypothetical protein